MLASSIAPAESPAQSNLKRRQRVRLFHGPNFLAVKVEEGAGGARSRDVIEAHVGLHEVVDLQGMAKGEVVLEERGAPVAVKVFLFGIIRLP